MQLNTATTNATLTLPPDTIGVTPLSGEIIDLQFRSRSSSGDLSQDAADGNHDRSSGKSERDKSARFREECCVSGD